MNPVLSLLDYSIYECTGIDAITKKEYISLSNSRHSLFTMNKPFTFAAQNM